MILTSSFTVWVVLKILILIFLSLYIVFSLVLIKQVQMMTVTLEIGFEKQLKLLAFAHALFAIGVFVFGIIIL
jgi:hypothetical protein